MAVGYRPHGVDDSRVRSVALFDSLMDYLPSRDTAAIVQIEFGALCIRIVVASPASVGWSDNPERRKVSGVMRQPPWYSSAGPNDRESARSDRRGCDCRVTSLVWLRRRERNS